MWPWTRNCKVYQDGSTNLVSGWKARCTRIFDAEPSMMTLLESIAYLAFVLIARYFLFVKPSAQFLHRWFKSPNRVSLCNADRSCILATRRKSEQTDENLDEASHLSHLIHIALPNFRISCCTDVRQKNRLSTIWSSSFPTSDFSFKFSFKYTLKSKSLITDESISAAMLSTIWS